jgi:hypothetical protein
MDLLAVMGCTMDEKHAKFELKKVFIADSAEIVASREKALILHGSKDIDAAGDEVEQTVRKVLRRKLPGFYYVGHGHIVDATWASSPQMDVVIADAANLPVLFKAENGTEYFPYEGVYAVGEIKSTYYNSKKYVDTFVSNVWKIRSTLQRAEVPPNQVIPELRLSTNVDSRPYRNPLFSFMLFVNSGDFNLDQLRPLYNTLPAFDLPNILCFLDKGVLVNTKIIEETDGSMIAGDINITPGFGDWSGNNRWNFLQFNSSAYPSSLTMLYGILMAHLESSVLSKPNMLDYINAGTLDENTGFLL